MRQRILLILTFVCMGYVAVIWAKNEDVWVGTRFTPKQCLAIVEGNFEVKHKLCTISYEIRPQEDRFLVNGNLRFNGQFIPDTVSKVELEILLIDENRVCTKQLNLRKDVIQGEAGFSFVAQNQPDQRYVRTYYVIYYQ